MALRLILSRHAKSSWKQPGVSDHDRPLNARGRASARAVGQWLRDKGYVPDTVLCSTSARTRETYALMDVGGAATFDQSLYLASADRMLQALKQATGKTVLMLGHNPGTGELAERLAAKLPTHQRFLHYPTCATTVMDFAADRWDQVGFGTADVRAFVIPRELT